MDEIKNLTNTVTLNRQIPNTNSLGKNGPATPQEYAKAREAAVQFESLLLHQMFNSMSANVSHDSLLGGGRDQEFARDMYNQALAESIAKGQGLGIRDVLEKEMIKNIDKLSNK